MILVPSVPIGVYLGCRVVQDPIRVLLVLVQALLALA